MSHNRKETEALKDRINQLVEYLLKYAYAHPDLFSLEKYEADAKAFWQE